MCVVVVVIQLWRACVIRAVRCGRRVLARALCLGRRRVGMRGVWRERGLCCRCLCWVQRVAGDAACVVWWIEW